MPDQQADPERDDQRRIYYGVHRRGGAALEEELKRYRGVVATGVS